MSRPRITDPLQLPLPLEERHHVVASQGRPGGNIAEKDATGMLVFRIVVLNVEQRSVLGRRIKVSLKTRNRTEAEERRDIALAALLKCGLIGYGQRYRPEIYMDGQPGPEEDTILGPADLAAKLRAAREDVATPAPPAPPADPARSLFADR